MPEMAKDDQLGAGHVHAADAGGHFRVAHRHHRPAEAGPADVVQDEPADDQEDEDQDEVARSDAERDPPDLGPVHVQVLGVAGEVGAGEQGGVGGVGGGQGDQGEVEAPDPQGGQADEHGDGRHGDGHQDEPQHERQPVVAGGGVDAGVDAHEEGAHAHERGLGQGQLPGPAGDEHDAHGPQRVAGGGHGQEQPVARLLRQVERDAADETGVGQPAGEDEPGPVQYSAPCTWDHSRALDPMRRATRAAPKATISRMPKTSNS